MRLLIKQRVFSWTDSYDVYDQFENAKYYVKAELLSIGHQIHIYDKQTNREMGAVRQKLFSFMPRFEIEIDGNCIGTIEKEFTFFKPVYQIDCNGWQIEGDFLGWDYDVLDDGGTVMHISKEPFNWGDTYVIDYKNQEDELMGLLLVIAIDAANCRDRS